MNTGEVNFRATERGWKCSELDSHLLLKGYQKGARTFIHTVDEVVIWTVKGKKKHCDPGENSRRKQHLKFPNTSPMSSLSKEQTLQKQRVPELCFSIICIIQFDGWILISIPSSFVSADYKRAVSSAMQATKKRLSKGRNGLSSQDPSIVLQIDSRWGSFGKFSRRKIARPCSACERQGGFTVGMVLRNSNTTHVWWDFEKMNAGPQISCCGWLQLH